MMKLLFFLTFTAFLFKCTSPNDITKPVVSITSVPATEGVDVIFTIALSSTSTSDTTIDVTTTANTASTND